MIKIVPWHKATVLSRKQLSPTVTKLTLQIQPPNTEDRPTTPFTFLPGQWVDFKPLLTPSPTSPSSSRPVPPKDAIGGYSITSIPSNLPLFELAIQKSRHPVAEWVALHAQPEDLVTVRVGGNFTYSSPSRSSSNRDNVNVMEQSQTKKKNLLFIAGGVGINPLFSMIRQWHEDFSNGKIARDSKAVLLYSGRSTKELLFLQELEQMAGLTPMNFRIMTSVTRQKPSTFKEMRNNSETIPGMKHISIREGRISSTMISYARKWIHQTKSCENVHANDSFTALSEESDDEVHFFDLAFVCGPPGMPEDMLNILLPTSEESELSFVKSENDVYFEKWW